MWVLILLIHLILLNPLNFFYLLRMLLVFLFLAILGFLPCFRLMMTLCFVSLCFDVVFFHDFVIESDFDKCFVLINRVFCCCGYAFFDAFICYDNVTIVDLFVIIDEMRSFDPFNFTILLTRLTNSAIFYCRVDAKNDGLEFWFFRIVKTYICMSSLNSTACKWSGRFTIECYEDLLVEDLKCNDIMEIKVILCSFRRFQ